VQPHIELIQLTSYRNTDMRAGLSYLQVLVPSLDDPGVTGKHDYTPKQLKDTKPFFLSPQSTNTVMR
jgi:hypothetical protein